MLQGGDALRCLPLNDVKPQCATPQVLSSATILGIECRNDRRQFLIVRGKPGRQDDFHPACTAQQPAPNKVLLVVIPPPPVGWVIVRQEEVMYPDEDTGLKPRDDIEQQDGDVAAHEGIVRTVDEQHIAWT